MPIVARNFATREKQRRKCIDEHRNLRIGTRGSVDLVQSEAEFTLSLQYELILKDPRNCSFRRRSSVTSLKILEHGILKLLES